MTRHILVLHGFPNRETKDRPLSSYLSSLGFQVINPDLFIEGIRFGSDEFLDYIDEHIRGRKIEAIAGVSMGGLVLPLLLERYKDAKAVFLATGPRLAPKNNIKTMIRIARPILPILKLLILMFPKNLLVWTYSNVLVRNKKDPKSYLENIDSLKKIRCSKMHEIIDFAMKTNNLKILSEAENKALVVSCKDDLLMPLELGNEIASVMKNSQFITTKGVHRDVLNNSTKNKIKEFLETH